MHVSYGKSRRCGAWWHGRLVGVIFASLCFHGRHKLRVCSLLNVWYSVQSTSRQLATTQIQR